jgi:putative chitinase
MKLFGNKKEDTGDKSSSPVASEKTKESASLFKKTVSKIGSLFKSKKNIEDTVDPMSNAEYLGEIYKLIVQNSDDIKLEREQQVNRREEEDSEEQKRHSEIIKALTIRRRPKPKRVIRREKKAEEKAKEPPKKPEPSKPAEPTKKPEPSKPAEPAKPSEPPKKPTEPTKPVEKPKAEPVKEAPKQPPTKPAEPVKPAPPKAEPVRPKPEPVKPPKAEPVKPAPKIPAISGTKGVAVAALVAAGLSAKAQANIMSQIEAESNFQPRSENLNYSSAERIHKKFGKKRFPTIESAEPYVNNPEKLANYAYAKTDGNSEPGDGWKYRGRGFLQHTGKNQYKEISKYTGIDVLNNPDLLNDPTVAAKAVPWFFLKYKNKKPEQLDDISVVNSAVGFAGGKEESKKREELSLKYQKEISTTPMPSSTSNAGDKIDGVSKDNKDMKKQDTPAPITIQQNTTNVNNTSESSNAPKVDDRPAHQRK